jgi:hypothetical protein
LRQKLTLQTATYMSVEISGSFGVIRNNVLTRKKISEKTRWREGRIITIWLTNERAVLLPLAIYEHCSH